MSGIHFHITALGDIDYGSGVHIVFAVAVPLAVMLFNILNLSVFADKKGVNTVVAGFLFTAVVNTAPRDYSDVGVFADNKVVIHKVVKPRFTYYYGNVYGFALGFGLYYYVDSRGVGFGSDVDIFGNVTVGKLSVCPYIVRALGGGVHIRDNL